MAATIVPFAAGARPLLVRVVGAGLVFGVDEVTETEGTVKGRADIIQEAEILQRMGRPE